MSRIALGLCGLLSFGVFSRGTELLPGRSAPELDALFQCTNGWIGADGAFSLPLATNTTLWLFSDTFIGEIKDGKRLNAKMINNSIALQRGTNRPEFFYGKTPDGKSESFIIPKDGRGYFWLFHGARTTNGLWFFLRQMETIKAGTPFGFRYVANWLGQIENPDETPPSWRVTQIKEPFSVRTPQGALIFGGAVIQNGGFIYIGGTDTRQESRKKFGHGGMVLARVPSQSFGDFKRWQFYSDKGWQQDSKKVKPVFADVASEFSLSWHPGSKKFTAVYMAGSISGNIVIRHAPALVGPWSEPIQVYRCPEMGWPVKVFCYAAKAHPELATAPDELVITYAANAWDFWDVFRDARIYWPRFVRVSKQAGISP